MTACFPPSLPIWDFKGWKIYLGTIIMPDEITIKPKSESAPATAPENQTASSGRTPLTSLCALGLGVSFFLPWANFFGAMVSGFDLQKLGDEQRLLWLIPIFSPSQSLPVSPNGARNHRPTHRRTSLFRRRILV